jgi:hypothetical protein
MKGSEGGNGVIAPRNERKAIGALLHKKYTVMQPILIEAC